MTRRETLVGFIGDRPGTNARLVARDAVTRLDDGTLLRYPAGGGRAERMHPIDEQYISPVPNRVVEKWHSGDVVWVAERIFVARGLANSTVRDLLSDWALTDRGDRICVGSPRQLRGARDAAAKALSDQIGGYLFDHLEKSHGQAKAVLDLFLAVENAATQRRFLTAALYFHEVRDQELFNRQRIRAVASGAFEDFGAFDSAFRSRRDWLVNARLSELTTSQGEQVKAVSTMEAVKMIAWLNAASPTSIKRQRHHVQEALAPNASYLLVRNTLGQLGDEALAGYWADFRALSTAVDARQGRRGIVDVGRVPSDYNEERELQ